MKILSSISPTQLDTWTDCRLKWRWANPAGYQPIKRSAALELGVGIHEALARYYELMRIGTRSDPVSDFTDWSDYQIARLDADDITYEDDLKSLVETRTMGIAIMEGYVQHYKVEPFEIIEVEKTVSKPLPDTDWTLEARVDAVVRQNGKLYILEHKTFTSLDVEQLDREHQFVAEAWLAESLGLGRISGVIYNGMRKQVPSPRVKNALFVRHYLDITGPQVKHWLKRCRSMHDQLTAGRLSIYPEPSTMKCRFCNFKQPCTEYMRGGDFQFLLDTLYTKREDRNADKSYESA